jgi:signal transduction histidine kinase
MSSPAGNAETGQLLEEQAALRRVATLVAQEAQPEDVFSAVAKEVAGLIPVTNVFMARLEPDGTVTIVAGWNARGKLAFPVGERWDPSGTHVTAKVLSTGESARLDDYSAASGPIGGRARAAGFRSAVGTPIRVEGRLWGVTSAASIVESLPAEAEARLASFTELVAMAIANTESRASLARLAAEQAALRRVAVLVAEGAPPVAVFDAVAAETLNLMGADSARVCRYESDDTATILASRSRVDEPVPVGTRLTLEGESVTARVFRTQSPSRRDGFEEAGGVLGMLSRERGLRRAVGAPIVVDGRLWGLIVAHWTGDEPLADDAETRIAQFAALIATAIATANSRDELVASRARVLGAADEARRRVVRDLHDGAQEHLVNTIITLKLAKRAAQDDPARAEEMISKALEQAEEANEELRELAHGILPSVLLRGGIEAGVDALASRLPLPVTVDVSAPRVEPGIEASAYFVVAEALTNVVKHAGAQAAEVIATVRNGELCVEIRDDGVGGADPEGHGLIGMADRVTALGGRITVESPTGLGTVVIVALPLPVS